DLRYEARDIDQHLTSAKKVDEWFETNTSGLSRIAKTQLKQKWGTMQKVLSSKSRLEKIVMDIWLDMKKRPRLMDGHGNAMLVSATVQHAPHIRDLYADGWNEPRLLCKAARTLCRGVSAHIHQMD